jgi:solute carrier family 45, member 1/2/4
MADGDGPSRADEAEDAKETSPTLSGETPTNAEGTSKPIHEESPLLSASGDAEDDDLIVDNGGLDDGLDDDHDDYHDTKSLWYMILLTISIGGLQLAWAVELSNGTPYLLSLGLSKSLMALVWIAGPLSGALVQPYVGILSDNCRSPWGKRTPFMIAGSAATIISLLALAWAREIVGGFLSIFGADRASQGVKVSIIVFAVLWVYILDFSINTGRSLFLC